MFQPLMQQRVKFTSVVKINLNQILKQMPEWFPKKSYTTMQEAKGRT